jgi:flagellin
MALSVQTNRAALSALQNLNRTNDKLADVQVRINTGLKVNGPKDNASTWAVAQGQRADIGALAAVKTSLDRATSIVDVALAAGETVSDLLNELKAKATAATDPSITPESRKAIDNDFKALVRQITQTVAAAEFDGANLLNNSLTAPIKFLASADATQTIDLTPRNLTVGTTTGITVTTTDDLLTTANATAALERVTTSINNVNGLLAEIGSEAKQIDAHNRFVSKLSDTLEGGVSNLVDADLAKESARLQALQVQQQLGAQALGIANQQPQLILSLFQS